MENISPQPHTPLHKYLLVFLGLTGFCLSLTILYLCMRAIMEVGGYCAEGGPYEIQVHCPSGTAVMAPLSVFSMIIFGLIYFIYLVPNAFNFGYLFWTALFGSLGWNFLDFTIQSYYQKTLQIGWMICAIIFLLMAIGPVFLLSSGEFKFLMFNNQQPPTQQLHILLFAFQLIAIILGIWLGILIFNNIS